MDLYILAFKNVYLCTLNSTDSATVVKAKTDDGEEEGEYFEESCQVGEGINIDKRTTRNKYLSYLIYI